MLRNEAKHSSNYVPTYYRIKKSDLNVKMKCRLIFKKQSDFTAASSNMLLFWWAFILYIGVFVKCSVLAVKACPPTGIILPCRCSLNGIEVQIWCSHSNLPQIMEGIKAVEHNIKSPIDELVLENNQLPALPGRFFGSLQIVRLMLRYNNIERVSNGWLNELENSLVEIYVVEPQLRSIPTESLNGMINMIAITIESEELKHLPDFSGLLSLTYLSVHSASIMEIQPNLFRHLPKIQSLHISGGLNLNRLEENMLDNLISLENIDFSHNGIQWIHLRALNRLQSVANLKLTHNRINDVGMVGRIIKDMENLRKLRLDHNKISVIKEGSFVDLPNLKEMHLNDNKITKIEYGAFLRAPMLKTIYLQNNQISRIHPESFLQSSGSGVETVYLYNNKIEQVEELRSLFESLPTLKFLDISSNYLTSIPFGAIRGHGTLEQIYINSNMIHIIERDAFIAMPALRELRLRNNSLSQEVSMPFWNLPSLKGLDLSMNKFIAIDSFLLSGLPSLRRLDLSDNHLSKVDPSSFQHNPMLETLNISFNALTSVHPITFRNLDRLFEIDASFNQLKEMIPFLPKIIERISLRGNSLKTLLPSEKRSLNLPNLRMLDLSLNFLEHLPKHALQDARQLRVLSLANNRLKLLHYAAFTGVQRLELLHLQENEISEIDKRTFIGTPELRNLNLQGNKMKVITDNLFANNSLLEQLDLSRNFIQAIELSAFKEQRSLEYFDLSENNLSDLSISLSNLKNLQIIDLSFNQISRIFDDVVSAWNNVTEILLSNNLITELKYKTFHDMPKLQYLDLSSNAISTIESEAFNNLPALQELALADNKLIELKDHVFENLPNLLASHFQYNMLQYISPNCFSNSPSMLFLNLSNNAFRVMENIGLRNTRNLEVLDLSANNVELVTSMPLKSLNWLVEFRMDNNRICKIEGSPFEAMPRLRVLSLRNNFMKLMNEKTFRNLRGNIAVLDVDGNPIECTCEMRWLSVWLHETNFPYPGPKCKDGRLLRSFRIENNFCTDSAEENLHTVNSNNAKAVSNVNQTPLLNELQTFSGECSSYELSTGKRPLVGESEYFYDHYVDYAPGENSSFLNSTLGLGSNSNVFDIYKKQEANYSFGLNNTILNTNYFKQRPPHISSSPFTFFGYPIPSLSLSRFLGASQRERKYRGDHSSLAPPTRPYNEFQVSQRMEVRPSEPTSERKRTKMRMYQANNLEFEKYLSRKNSNSTTTPLPVSTVEHPSDSHNQYYDVDARTQYSKNFDFERPEVEDTTYIDGQFRTAFKEPASIEHGGFRPIVSKQTFRGFKPVQESKNTKTNFASSKILSALHDSISNKSAKETYKHSFENVHEENFVPVGTLRQEKTMVPQTLNDTKQFSNSGSSDKASVEIPPISLRRSESALSATTITPTTLNTALDLLPTTVPERFDLISTEMEISSNFETESVSYYNPPNHLPSTNSKTILLIPPPGEYITKNNHLSWMQPKTSMDKEQKVVTSTKRPLTEPTKQPSGNVGSGRPTISRVYTQKQLHQVLPTAEEYYHRPTTLRSILSDELEPTLPNDDFKMQKPVDSQKRSKFDSKALYEKDDMDWYYKSFKYQNPKSSFSNDDINQENTANAEEIGYSRHSAACDKQIRSVIYISISFSLLICYYKRCI